MFEYLKKNELMSLRKERPNDIFVIIDKTISGERNLIDTISAQIESPYEGDNWDGFYDAIGTLTWLSNQVVSIIHLDLPDLNDRDMEIYLDILRAVDDEWNGSGKGKYPYPENVEVNIYFLKEHEDMVKNILQRVDKMKR